MRTLTKAVLWRAGKSFVRLVGKLDTEASEGGIWEARNPGVAIRDGSPVISERRLSRRGEATEVPAAGPRKLAHYRHTSGVN